MNVAVIGCGYWGKNLVRNFHELGRLAQVCDQTIAGRETASKIAPDVTILEDVQDVFQSEVAGVVIATPAETHFSLAKGALEAGKDVFVEKPLALSLDEGAELVRIAEQRQRVLMVGHVLEYHPAIIELVTLVRSGELGRVQYVYSNRLSLGKIRQEENVLWSFAPHDFAVLLRLVDSQPLKVAANGGSFVQPDIADTVVANLSFKNGARAHVHVSWLHPFKEQRLVIVGSRKMATFDDVQKQLLVYDQRVVIENGKPVPVKNQGEIVEYSGDEPLRLECEAFLDAMKTRRQSITDGRSGLAVLQVLQAAQTSLVQGGEVVPLPPASVETSHLSEKA